MAKKKDKHQHKTNAVRIVEAAGIPYEMHEYEAPEGFLDGVSVAKALGQEPGSVFKTLVTVGQSREYYVCEIPVDKELDLKKAAKHFGEKKLEMLPSKLLTATTGYIKGGCSPVGMKKEFPTAIDASAEQLEKIAVSGGTADGAAGESFAGNHGSLFCGSHRGQITGRRAEYINYQKILW